MPYLIRMYAMLLMDFDSLHSCKSTDTTARARRDPAVVHIQIYELQVTLLRKVNRIAQLIIIHSAIYRFSF